MSLTRLSAEELKEGVESQFSRKFELKSFKDSEVEQAIGSTLEEKSDQGFQHIAIIFPVFAPFFLSKNPTITNSRENFIKEKGGEDDIEFHQVIRTGEIVVLMK